MLSKKPWLGELSAKADVQTLRDLVSSLDQRLLDSRWDKQRKAVALISDLKADRILCHQAEVSFERDAALSADERERLTSTLRALMPWKKGPFHILGESIDAEWRSDLKWQRLAETVGSLDGQIVGDIGSHNGYFMYRMLAHGARHVIGFEPFAQLWFTFALFQSLYRCEALHFELLGVEHTELFAESFDTLFCLGILYHHTDPVGLLRKMRRAIRPKGRVFIDCQGIEGEAPLSLTPQGRYAGAGGVWFLPTMKTLENWALRAGFTRFERIYSAPLSIEEQRSTAWAPVQSLADFLDPENPQLTREGYPAPYRHYLLIRP